MPNFQRSARLSWGIMCLTAVSCAVTIVGCASWRGTDPVIQNKLVEYYDRLAVEVANQPEPAAQSPLPPPTLGEGRALVPPKIEDRWLMSLSEAIRMGVENNSIIRQNAQFMSPNNPVMQAADTVPSVYDPIIQNAGVLFGQRGVDASLSDFDPRITNQTKVVRDEQVQNVTINAPPNNVLANEGVQYQTRYEQQLLSGGLFGVNNNWNFQQTNQPFVLFQSSYTGILGMDFRQPLWAGAGREFVSIAGPLAQRARGFSYVNQGVVIAHINNRLSEIDLQENLQNLVREIGDLYWDLYQNYADYESDRDSAKHAKLLWERAKGREGLDPGVEEAQAEDTYYEAKAREELALSNLFLNESRFRRLIGVSLDDPRMIYPSDEPREDEVELSRARCLYEALVNRLELTRQKINIHSLELQLIAAKKLVAPRFDFIAGYGLNGFGNRFYDTGGGNFNSALTNIFSGKETSWDVGFEYALPLWLRQEKAQVRQLEFKIVKARSALASQESEIAYELNSVLMTVKRAHSMSKIARRRVRAAKRRVIAAESDYEAGNKSNDLVLRALTSQTQAQSAYSKSIAEYNKALRDLLFRTGRILPADGISLLGTDGLPLLPPAEFELPAPRDSREIEKEDGDDPDEENVDPRIPPLPKKDKGVASIHGFTEEDLEEEPSIHRDSQFAEFLSTLTETQLIREIDSNSAEEATNWDDSDDVRPVSGKR